MRPSYAQASIRTVSAANGIEYAYREVGGGGAAEIDPSPVLDVFHTPSSESRSVGEKAMGRMLTREELDTPTTWQTRQAQYGAVTARGIPDITLLERVTAIQAPVFVANSDSDSDSDR
ncbi:hypothetical protein ACFXGI_02500 [Streptomyces sp. NPDC059355]|uniref:hypothetical protein n=1 Tax=Streptomyces sp. NPDC059355 TaxID=3346811 RepID=UPI00368F1968